MSPISTHTPFERVGIVGLGLMGGSLARALKALPSPPSVRALSRDPSDLHGGLEAGVLDELAEDPVAFSSEDPGAFFRGLDLVVYCTPLNTALHLLEVHRDLLDPGTVITDVVSLKTPILERAEALGLGSAFVGSHPMAGGEGRGFAHSRADLFQDARVWIVPGRAGEERVERIEGLWRGLGGRGMRTDARRHDDLMAWVSHLPQVAANALALALEGEGIPRSRLGPGGREMTRLAGSSPEMWKDLLEHAPDALPTALEAVGEALEELRILVARRDGERLAERMDRTRRWVKAESRKEEE